MFRGPRGYTQRDTRRKWATEVSGAAHSLWQTYLRLATSLRPLRLTVSALASSTSRLPMPVLSTFPSPATHRPEDHLQPVPVGDPHGYSRRRSGQRGENRPFPFNMPEGWPQSEHAWHTGLLVSLSVPVRRTRWQSNPMDPSATQLFVEPSGTDMPGLSCEGDEPCSGPNHRPRPATYICVQAQLTRMGRRVVDRRHIRPHAAQDWCSVYDSSFIDIVCYPQCGKHSFIL